jgi:arylsulfatase
MSISRRHLLRSAAMGAVLSGVACTSNTGGSGDQKASATDASKKKGAPKSVNSKTQSPWPVKDGAKRPNIVVAIFDDVGFGDLGCFGSEIDTSAVDRLAENGVRYNNFHVTALCAPTRACLMTGQNAHRVGVGNIAEWGRALPGYRGYIREDVKLLPQYLKESGYNTIAIGKWHMSMVNDQDAMGPFDHWPMGRGFDHWYGFHGSAVDHFYPEVFRNQTQVHPDMTGDYHLSEDLANQAIAYVKDHKVATPDKPFFLYMGFGACHFPFHAPQSYIDKYKGQFDQGYDALRAPRLARQEKLGVVPPGTELSPRPDDIPPWASLPDDEKAFSLRTQQAFAGMLDHADDQLGRFVDALRDMGELDDTILIVMSDNGAGGGYHRAGALDVRRIAYIGPETVGEKMRSLENVGGPQSNPLYSTGWSHLGNTPLKRRKGDTYAGGTRTPMIVHWPNGNLPTGKICSQYHHIIDILPTLADLTEITPDYSQSLDGISLAYSLKSPDAQTKKTVQHFETAGDRAIWAEGWKAVTQHQKGDAFEDDVWALYHAEKDFSEVRDLAADNPDRLKSLISLWNKEAAANNVLPLDDDLDGLYAKVAPKPRSQYVFYPGQTRFNRLSAPDIYRYDFEVRADVALQSDRAEGVLLASGDSCAGYEWYMQDGFLHFNYVYTRENVYRFKSARRVPKGTQSLFLKGDVSGEGTGRLSMRAGQQSLGQFDLPNMWKTEALNAGIRCGENRGAPIVFPNKNIGPFEYGLTKITFDLAL